MNKSLCSAAFAGFRLAAKTPAASPSSQWNFKPAPAARHLGPMAQDFYGAFGVGLDDKTICTVDESRVALAAIQGLNEKLETGRQNSECRSSRPRIRN